MDEEEIVIAEEAEGAEVIPTEPEVTEVTEGSTLTLEAVHALVLELQAEVQNLRAIADQATPIEPAAEEAEEDETEAGLLDDGESTEQAPEEDDIEELDKMLQD